MTNSERFETLVNEYLKMDNTYKNPINCFLEFLTENNYKEKVFNLNITHIDEYFIYSFKKNIGIDTTLNTHIAALKSLFNFLLEKEIDFKGLLGYISSEKYRKKT